MTHLDITAPTDSPGWYAEYRAICVKGFAAILRRELAPSQLAEFVLANFSPHLSPSAIARWQGIAGKEGGA